MDNDELKIIESKIRELLNDKKVIPQVRTNNALRYLSKYRVISVNPHLKSEGSSAADKPGLGADFEQRFETNPLCFILFRNFFICISKNSHEIF